LRSNCYKSSGDSAFEQLSTALASRHTLSRSNGKKRVNEMTDPMETMLYAMMSITPFMAIGYALMNVHP
jgi:hypothetical protein